MFTVFSVLLLALLGWAAEAAPTTAAQRQEVKLTAASANEDILGIGPDWLLLTAAYPATVRLRWTARRWKGRK